MKKWLIALLVVVGGCCGLGSVVIFWTGVGPYDLPPAARRLDAELERSRKLGLPQVQSELKRNVPDRENAALIIAPLFQKKDGGKSLANLISDYDKGVAGSEAAVRSELASRKADLDLVGKTTLSKWEVDRDYDRGVYVDFPEFAASKDMVRALAVRARIAAKEGRTADAVRDLEAARRMGSWMSQEPNLIGMLVAIALDAIACRGYEAAATEWRRNPAALQKLQASFERSSFDLDYKRAMTGEYYSALSVGRNLNGFEGLKALSGSVSGGEDAEVPDFENLVREGAPKGMVERAFLSSAVKSFNDLFDAYDAEGWETRGVGSTVEAKVNKELDSHKMSYLLAAILFPVFKGAEDAMVRRKAASEMTQMLLSARVVKARTGRWPELQKPDLFAHGDFYQVSSSGDAIRIWSVGPNGTNEGGLTANTKDDDVVVASPR